MSTTLDALKDAAERLTGDAYNHVACVVGSIRSERAQKRIHDALLAILIPLATSHMLQAFYRAVIFMGSGESKQRMARYTPPP